ncbi:MAG: 50S ribosomal protein L11 methyltransferase [Porphyromonas sp.]|nr:50S ribosomal protein L11 methyltransferase [Porphyromonas sp.]
MKYIQYKFKILPSDCVEDTDMAVIFDILSQFLADGGFESFEQTDDGLLLAYAPQNPILSDVVKNAITTPPINSLGIEFSSIEMEDKNWNEEWEKNFFSPISVADCYIRAPFHSPYSGTMPCMELLIQPQMSFGTGHHSTTSGMISLLSDTDLKNKSIVDMGCGTGILALYTALKGAKNITAIDIDEWCYQNTIDNAHLNNVSELTVLHGDAQLLKQIAPADIFIANINRNIILEDLHLYIPTIKPHGSIFLSGFYERDVVMIEKALSEYGFEIKRKIVNNDWCALMATKNYQ